MDAKCNPDPDPVSVSEDVVGGGGGDCPILRDGASIKTLCGSDGDCNFDSD